MDNRPMRIVRFLVLAAFVPALAALGASTRFIIDDDDYANRVAANCAKLLAAGKLLSAESLRGQVKTKGCTIKAAPRSSRKLEPPELCDYLRESTLAVGSFYKCPDCGE